METWKAIPGYEGRYEVSDRGQVRSLDRDVTCKGGRVIRCKGRMLTPKPNMGGYPSLRLGRGNPVMVHQIVAQAFLGPADGRYTCHSNGVKTDNRLANLRYDTACANQADRARHGTETYGSALPQAKLNESQVAEIKRRLALNETHENIAADYVICRATISAIAAGKIWRRVSEKD